MPRLLHEIHRYYGDDYRRGRGRSLERRPHRPLARTFDTPLKMLVLVGIGAALSPLVPSLVLVVTGCRTHGSRPSRVVDLAAL